MSTIATKITIKDFPKTGYFTYKNLMSKSRSTLYRIKKQEEQSYGTFSWYQYPGNIKKLLKHCLNKKK